MGGRGPWFLHQHGTPGIVGLFPRKVVRQGMKAHPLLQRVVVDPAIQHGKPCVKGTRTPVYVVLEALAVGMDPAAIKREYPPLTEEDIHACLYYASCLADETEIASPSLSTP